MPQRTVHASRRPRSRCRATDHRPTLIVATAVAILLLGGVMAASEPTTSDRLASDPTCALVCAGPTTAIRPDRSTCDSPIAGAHVVLINGEQQRLSVTTDAKGRWSFAEGKNIPLYGVDMETFTVSAEGYETLQVRGQRILSTNVMRSVAMLRPLPQAPVPEARRQQP